jgi:hypothetical protein
MIEKADGGAKAFAAMRRFRGDAKISRRCED